MRLPLRPSRWPVRWRLALASAGLTLTILLVFAGVVGYLAGERVREDFNRDLDEAAAGIAARTQILVTPDGGYLYQGPVLSPVAAANRAWIRVSTLDGTVLRESLGVLEPEGDAGSPDLAGESLRVATAGVIDDGQTVGYVEYAQSTEQLDSTVARIWLFIAAGVLGGTLLASLAGLAIADRAMRPVGAITATAREVATTRDPSKRMPEPASEDEIGELTATLAEMLRSLEASGQERETAMQRQREFVADASHELRTPLTSVLANLELLQETLAGRDAEDSEIAASALRSSRRMSRLVADLLILARADAGRRSAREACDLSEVVRDAAAEAAPVLGNHELELREIQPAQVYGNRDELHRLVLNLLDNAAQHTPEGTRIELGAELSPGGEKALLTVADEGPGIPEELRGQVFERFARAGGPADTARTGGTGLGLAIVRSVAETHGGTVSVEDSPAGGASFTVVLPAATSEAAVTAGQNF